MTEEYLSTELGPGFDTADFDQVFRDPGILYPLSGQKQYLTQIINEYFQFERILAGLDFLPRIYHDDSDTGTQCSITAGRFFDSTGTERTPAASINNTLTPSDVNYLYYTDSGSLTINTTGFPVPTVTPPHPYRDYCGGR